MKGYSGESRFYFGNELYGHLQDLIDGATKIDIATAWVTDSNALKLLVSLAHKSGGVRIVAGVGRFATDPVALRKLGSTVGIDLRIYGDEGPPLFHPKLYIFKCQHWQRVLVGSMNFTRAGTSENIESVFSLEDKARIADREFARFWESPLAVRFSDFDLALYEAEQRIVLAAVKNAEAVAVLEDDVVATANNHLTVDALCGGWKEYVDELKTKEKDLRNYRYVLAARDQLVSHDWSEDLSEIQRQIMYGVRPYMAFGNLGLAKMHQEKFQGPENRWRRLQIGDALSRAMRLAEFQKAAVESVVDALLKVDFCGPALATRLLVLARPDFFIVYNEHSFQKLQKRFSESKDSVKVTPKQLTGRIYADLLERIHNEQWFKSAEPDDPSEREFWVARTAFLDSLVRDDNQSDS